MRKLSPVSRKLLTSVHIAFSGILLGCTVAFIVMDIAALATDDPKLLEACYRIMHLLSHTSLRASAIGAIVSGVLLSVLTPWGLLRFRWIVAKEILSLLTIVPGLFGIYAWSLRGLQRVADEGMGALNAPAFQTNGRMLSIGLLLQLLSILAMYMLSSFKPWGPVSSGGSKNKSTKRMPNSLLR
ncbi:DUF2269 family protein [Cohnella zeiphila]|uniref:DUF2269 family protein n=1 Tax=Cohnella zeiphila TaxID=2761120 RepID=A0A7X0SNW8_9BACL|nr:DUF2269 family protein [Cohnella zeiphila]MBB6733381.1 DUF2269 family protein [Cohnella zeiphila]